MTASLQATFIINFGNFGWQQLKIGGGGFVTGLSIANDGTTIARLDGMPAVAWFNSTAPNPGNAGGSGSWQSLVSSASMPAGSFTIDDAGSGNAGVGSLDAVVAPSNSLVIYMLWNGFCYYTSNRGGTWTQTAFTQDTNLNSNANNRTFAHRIAVDPQNPAVALVSSTTGLYYTTNSGTTFTQVSGLATPGSINSDFGCVMVAFDSSSAVSGGVTQGIYCSVSGTGVYHTTTGPAGTWTLTTSGPTNHWYMACGPTGVVWQIDHSNNLWKYTGTWTEPLTATNAYSVATDPASANNVYLATPGKVTYTRDGGTTWTTSATSTVTANDVPWQANTAGTFLSVGGIAFDPSQSNFLCFAWGFGFFTTTPPVTVGGTPALNWTTSVAGPGLEHLVTNWCLSPWTSGSNPVCMVWDLQLFVPNSNQYPSTQGVNNSSGTLNAGWSADWASASPSTIVTLINGEPGTTEFSAVSSNGGVTWSAFATMPPLLGTTGGGSGGSIAASSSTNFVMVRTDNSTHPNQPYFTTNGGTTWTAITMSGVPTSGTTGWGANFFANNQILCADRVNANTFYIYNNGNGTGNTGAGVWSSTNSGSTWTKQANPGSAAFFPQLRSVPGNAQHLFWTPGASAAPPTASGAFQFSSDGGATWHAVTNITGVLAFGFGAALPGGNGYPTVYIAGFNSGVYGIWRGVNFNSSTFAATWTNLGAYPGNSFDLVKCVEGDANTYGKVYVGFQGNSFMFYQGN